MKLNNMANLVLLTTLFAFNSPANAAEPKVDFNGDGRADVLLRNVFSGQMDSWLSNGNGGQKISYGTVSPNDGWSPLSTGDFNGDGRTDLLWYNSNTGDLGAWFINGGSILQGVSYGGENPTTRWFPISTGDFNGDGRTDLLWYKGDTGEIGVWLINGGAIQGVPYGAVNPSLGWIPVGKGDFNGDGRTDLLWYNGLTGENAAWLINANGSGVQAGVPFPTIPLGSGWFAIGSGDFNNDGRTDLLWSNSYTGQITAWLINGGSVGGASYGSVLSNTGWAPVGLDDFDGNGTTDIFWFNRFAYQAVTWFISGSSVPGTALYGTVTPASLWMMQIPSQPSQ